MCGDITRVETAHALTEGLRQVTTVNPEEGLFTHPHAALLGHATPASEFAIMEHALKGSAGSVQMMERRGRETKGGRERGTAL